MFKDQRTIDFIVHEAVSLGLGKSDLLALRNEIEQSGEVYRLASIYLFSTSERAEINKAKLHAGLQTLLSLVRN